MPAHLLAEPGNVAVVHVQPVNDQIGPRTLPQTPAGAWVATAFLLVDMAGGTGLDRQGVARTVERSTAWGLQARR
jgi:hypothetical protein